MAQNFIQDSLVHEMLLKVKQSRKYSAISNEIIVEEIKKYLNKNPKILKNNRFKKKNVQEIKSSLHRLSGSYQASKKNKRESYLEELKNNPKNIRIINKILQTQKSTQERLNDYRYIYKQIFNVTKIPDSVVDLGCGINPISIPYMNLKKLDYYAYDIDESGINFLNKFFQIEKNQRLSGKAEILDVKNLDKLSKLPNVDIIFMFKLIDLIDTKKKKLSEPIIKILIDKSKFLVISFATKTLTGKPMNLPRRKGFELMLERNNIRFKTMKTKNEIFYAISKNK